MGVLDGKVAVITGSSKGLGLAIASAYAQAGASVVLASRSQAALADAVKMLQQQDAQATALPTDVSVLEEVQALAAHAVQTFGKLDIWVNNAGTSDIYGPTASIDPARFEQVLRTNIFGEYYGSLVAINYFLAQGTNGKLINLLGRGDRQPVAFQNAYASSKAWVRNFTLALAKEYAESGIGIYALNPGLVDTDLLRKVSAVEGYEQKLKPLSTIIRLWGNPPPVPAQKAVWLASAATDGKTGLEVQFLGRPQVFAGLLKDLSRRVRRQSPPVLPLEITSVAPYHMSTSIQEEHSRMVAQPDEHSRGKPSSR